MKSKKNFIKLDLEDLKKHAPQTNFPDNLDEMLMSPKKEKASHHDGLLQNQFHKLKSMLKDYQSERIEKAKHIIPTSSSFDKFGLFED
mmetsp:Transcript_16911/g.26023  ORF Transcript_16911/g.26023 Transcript_16911/m.26023 type:complete len:88 (-) Transcript_16911:616-879(-)